MHAFCTWKREEQPGTGFLQVCTSKLACFAPDFTRGGWFHCLGLGELFASLTQFIDKMDKSFRKFQQVANACFRIWKSDVGEASGNVAVCCVGTLVPSLTVT